MIAVKEGAMEFASRYSHHGVRPGVAPAEGEVSVTKQEFCEECDINRIMSRYERSGELPAAAREALYGDFSEVADFLEAQGIVAHATAQFEALPARVRARFLNNAAAFLEFCANPLNAEEMRELGLLQVKEERKVVVPQGEVKVETLKTEAPPVAAK